MILSRKFRMLVLLAGTMLVTGHAVAQQQEPPPEQKIENTAPVRDTTPNETPNQIRHLLRTKPAFNEVSVSPVREVIRMYNQGKPTATKRYLLRKLLNKMTQQAIC